MLNPSAFATELTSFFVSGGFPAHREQARDRWAAAFFHYVSNLECTDPLLSPQRSATFALTESAFRGPLTLHKRMSAAEAASEFGAAWFAGTSAVVLLGLPPVTYSGVAVSTIVWTPGVLATKQAELVTTLTSLFETPAIRVSQRATEIANAFHAVTAGLPAQATLPGPALQALVYA